MPLSKDTGLTGTAKALYLMDYMYSPLRNMFICTECKATGKPNKGHRGGIHVNTDSNAYYEMARLIADTYGITLPVDKQIK